MTRQERSDKIKALYREMSAISAQANLDCGNDEVRSLARFKRSTEIMAEIDRLLMNNVL